MWHKVNAEIYLSEIVEKDREAFVEHLKEKEIHDWTSAMPFPYLEKDADEWIALNRSKLQTYGHPLNFAIRQSDSSLIGCVGFNDFTPGESHWAEIGYWLARPFWGKGIMVGCLNKLCEIGFHEFELVRIQSTIFDKNDRSVKVLEKCGFKLEGTLKSYFLKNNHVFDGKLYARIDEQALEPVK